MGEVILADPDVTSCGTVSAQSRQLANTLGRPLDRGQNIAPAYS